MRSTVAIGLGIAAILFGPAIAQLGTSSTNSQGPSKIARITLRTRIALPDDYGRIDYYGWDSKRSVLIVTALGNNTVEIVDQWKRVRSIAGLEHPQASIYIPDIDRIVVSSQSGKLRFYDAETYALYGTFSLLPGHGESDGLAPARGVPGGVVEMLLAGVAA